MSIQGRLGGKALRPPDVLTAAAVALAVLAAGAWYVPFGLGVAIGGALVVGFMCFRRLRTRQEACFSAVQEAQRWHYRQTEAVFSLFAVLRPRAPLPALRDWAISPDFALLLVNEIRAHRPRLVLKLGSGASTVVMAYALESAGAGRVISVDHEPAFARRTQALIAQHGLEAVAMLRIAPLAPIDLEGRVFSWYGPEAWSELGSIDLLVVDGPPGALGPQARYPAFPVLKGCLAADAVLVIDDGAREDEAELVKRWQALDPDLKAEYVDTEKGAYVLRRVPS